MNQRFVYAIITDKRFAIDSAGFQADGDVIKPEGASNDSYPGRDLEIIGPIDWSVYDRFQ